jgi:beta-glucanase (GH16 family)
MHWVSSVIVCCSLAVSPPAHCLFRFPALSVNAWSLHVAVVGGNVSIWVFEYYVQKKQLSTVYSVFVGKAKGGCNSAARAQTINTDTGEDMRMKKTIAALLAACILPTGAWAAEPATRAVVPAGWVLDWSDEFDGESLDHGKWVEETGGHGFGNNEEQYYTARPDNVRVANGKLVIEARREEYQGKHYTSARIKTAGLKERTHGRYEARIRIPRGQGIWPAFWLLGADVTTRGWPRCGEIDIMENIGKEPGIVHGTMHGPGYSGEHGVGKPQSLDSGSFADDYHVYAVEWEPREVRWYRDGILYHTARPDTVKGEWVFEHPFFVLLNLAVGGNWPGNADATTVLPQQMLVDYVRVYRRPG